uniref:SFRICE_009795 n=1 Tax=Spodoptera frugiperda TaxID=7108 RepID=A0A2H1V579_SPOFR
MTFRYFGNFSSAVIMALVTVPKYQKLIGINKHGYTIKARDYCIVDVRVEVKQSLKIFKQLACHWSKLFTPV